MRVDLVFGTRPEWLKLAPLLTTLREREGVVARAIFTGQHPDLVRPLLARWGVVPDVDLRDAPREGTLSTRLAHMLTPLDAALADDRPDIVVVQGDTLSTFAGALGALYRQIPLAHVEAGLRTHDLDSPFPEEFHRVAIARAARVHYCPTPRARENLLQEGIPPERVVVTGNTSMDTLRLAADMAPSGPDAAALEAGATPSTFLVTLHRRENLARIESDVLPGLLDVLEALPDMRLVWVLHPGPARARVEPLLAHHPRAQTVAPLDHVDLLRLLPRLGGVFTDSGGLSEECAALGVPALILRQATERVESLDGGNAALVGTSRASIVSETLPVLCNPAWVRAMKRPSSVYGDGFAAARIADHLESMLS